jgi:hypothetical protein
MRTVQIKVSETDFQKYNLGSGEIKFTDLVDLYQDLSDFKDFID